MTRTEFFREAAEQAPPTVLHGAPLRAALAAAPEKPAWREAADRAEAKARWSHTGWLLACVASGSGIVLIPAGCPCLIGRLASCLLFCACFLCFCFAWDALEDVALILRWRDGKAGEEGGES